MTRVRDRVQTAPPKAGDTRLAMMLDAIDLVGLILDPDGRIVYGNDALLQLTGWTRDEALGLDWFETFIPTEIRDDLRETLLGAIHEGLAPPRHINEILARSGERRLIAWYNVVLRDDAGRVDSLASVGRDRTEIRVAEQARQATEARLAAILGQLPGMLWTIDTDLRCTASLGAGLATLGLAPNQIVGLHLVDFVGTSDPDDPAIVAHHAALAGTPSRYDATFAGRRYECHVEPLHDADGMITGAVGISFDVTERVTAEEALQQADASTTAALDAAIESVAMYRPIFDAGGRFSDAELMFGNQIGRERWFGGATLEAVRGKHLFATYPDVRPLVFDLYADVVERQVAFRGLRTFPTPNGPRTYDLSITPFDGGFVHVGRDVTDERAAMTALERSEERLRRTLQGIDAIVSFQERSDAPVIISPQVEQILGYRPDQLTDHETWRALVHPDDLATAWAAWRTGTPAWSVEYRMRRADGRWIRVSDRGRRILRPDGDHGIFGVVVDVTEQREADEARRVADARIRAFFDADVIGVVMTDADERPVEANDYYLRVLGFTREELLNGEVDWRTVTPPEWEPADARAREERGRTGRCTPYEKEYQRRDGTRVQVLIALATLAGPPAESVGFVLDISDRREAEERFRATLETLLDPLVVFRPVRDDDGDGRIVDFTFDYANEAAAVYNQVAQDELIGRRLLDLLPAHGPSGMVDRLSRVIETGEPLVMDGYPYSDTWGGEQMTRVSDLRGQRLGETVVTSWRDVTERERTRQALSDAAARDRLLIEESADGIFRLERVTGAVLDVNPAGCAMLGVDREALIGERPLGRFVADPTDGPYWAEALDAGETAAFERTLMRPDGQSVILAVRARILPDGAVMASARDITAERELEARMLEGRRLEAIGKLAGGIAHDFNNMLAAISGYGELALGSLPADHPVRGDIDQMLFAADRAAILTRQLLAYSRRQVLTPEVLDPGAAIDRVVPMLGQLLGDGIDLGIDHAPGLWLVRADPGQLEQVLVNLAVNARDAMPGGGTLSIAAANVDPGMARREDAGVDACPCVRITVRDTGSGMDETTLGRIFEPFFTTKGPGKGSGMGLATVHGIVEQSGGTIRVESRPGRGTAFTIDLPRVDAPVTAAPQAPEPPSPVTGTETILVVEDEEAIRRFVERTLGGLGYTVRSAATGAVALDLVTSGATVPDLLVTDVQMPGIQGPDLARRLRASLPSLPTLFISGYSEELVDRAEGDPARVLEKPFDADSLATAVRASLDANRPGVS